MEGILNIVHRNGAVVKSEGPVDGTVLNLRRFANNPSDESYTVALLALLMVFQLVIEKHTYSTGT